MSTRHNGQHLRILLVLLMLGFAAFPIYWMFVTSMTPSSELFATSPRLLPEWSQLGIYLEVFNTIPVATWLKNSFLVAAGTTVLSILLAVLPAYALSRFRFTGLALLGFALFATQMLPEAMLVVPLYSIFADLNLLNTASGLILANTAFVVPVITWIIKGAIDGIPIEIEEAARVDGCSRLDIVLGIVIPLIAPTLAAAAVISFFHGWNEYVFAQTLTAARTCGPLRSVLQVSSASFPRPSIPSWRSASSTPCLPSSFIFSPNATWSPE